MKYSHYIPISIILLCILYFIYRFYKQKQEIDHFENSSRSDSIYYRNTVDSNDMDIFQKAISQIEQKGYQMMMNADPFTGAWSNFDSSDISSEDIQNDDMILLLRKIDSHLFIALTRRDLNMNDGGQSSLPDDTLYPMFMYVGLANIKTPSNAILYKTIVNNFSKNTSSKGIGMIHYDTNTKIMDLTLFGSKYSFDQKRELTKENYFTPLQVIAPAFKTEATTLTDVVCPNGKKKCRISNGSVENIPGCAIPSLINNDGTCQITTESVSDICYQGETDPSQNITIPKCPNDFNIIQNNVDFMMNNIFTKKNGSGSVIGCEYIDVLTKWDNYVVFYARDSRNLSTFGYQIWGFESNENKVVTKPSKVANMISTKLQQNPEILDSLKSSLNEPTTSKPTMDSKQVNTNDYPQIWKFNKSYQQGSCYFLIQSQKTANQPIYYLNYKDNGDLYMTLGSGGFNQFFTMDQFLTIHEDTSNKFGIYSGYIKASNQFYISPGRPDYQDLNPQSSLYDVKVCTLVSKFNQPGKWMILGFNGTLQDITQSISTSK